MMEARIYNGSMLAGIVLLLAGIFMHSWSLVAFGALIAGAGGFFGVFISAKDK